MFYALYRSGDYGNANYRNYKVVFLAQYTAIDVVKCALENLEKKE